MGVGDDLCTKVSSGHLSDHYNEKQIWRFRRVDTHLTFRTPTGCGRRDED